MAIVDLMAIGIIAFVSAMIGTFVVTTVVGVWKILNRGVQKW